MQQVQQQPQVQQQVYVPAPLSQPPVVPPETLKHPKIHKGFGITFLIVGTLMFVFDIIGFIVSDGYFLSGVGIWMGLFYILPGALILSASVQNGRCLLCGGLVFDIITACLGMTGMTFAIVEMTTRAVVSSNLMRYQYETYRNLSPISNFIYYKSVFDLLSIIVTSILIIVHSGFACHDWCSCCQSEQQNIPMTAQQPQGVQVAIYQQGQQQPMMQGQMHPAVMQPQQMGAYQQPVYPSQQVAYQQQGPYPQQGGYPQQNMYPNLPPQQSQPPINPACAGGMGPTSPPPSYQDISPPDNYPTKS